MNLRCGYVEESIEKAYRYLNGLRIEIQEEIRMIAPRIVEEEYQCALREEEKLVKKQNFKRGRSSDLGRGQASA